MRGPLASFRIDSPVAIAIMQRFSPIFDPKSPMRGHLAGGTPRYTAGNAAKIRRKRQKTRKTMQACPQPPSTPTPRRPRPPRGPRRPQEPSLATPARIRLCNEGSPHAGWGGACLWPAQSGYTRISHALVYRGWVYGAQAIQMRPLAWVAPCVVLGMTCFQRHGPSRWNSSRKSRHSEDIARFEVRMPRGVKQG